MTTPVIVLDFDGVIVESNNIKHEAFAEIFSSYPDHYDEMMRYHRAHNHVSRQEKFKFIMEHILNIKDNNKGIDDLIQTFSSITRQRIITCPYVAGAVEFITHFSSRSSLYMASATPLEELRIIIRERGLTVYFNNIYGAPTKKDVMFSEIIKIEKIKPDELVFIGDSCEDYEAACTAGVQFIARKTDFDFSKFSIPICKDMCEVKLYLEGMYTWAI
ncbi:MAG: HAD hydrolase-like protein [bacterium]